MCRVLYVKSRSDTIIPTITLIPLNDCNQALLIRIKDASNPMHPLYPEYPVYHRGDYFAD